MVSDASSVLPRGSRGDRRSRADYNKRLFTTCLLKRMLLQAPYASMRLMGGTANFKKDHLPKFWISVELPADAMVAKFSSQTRGWEGLAELRIRLGNDTRALCEQEAAAYFQELIGQQEATQRPDVPMLDEKAERVKGGGWAGHVKKTDALVGQVPWGPLSMAEGSARGNEEVKGSGCRA